MSRFHYQLTSAAALANNTGFLWGNSPASGGFKLRRATIGLSVSTGATITNAQVLVGINRTTSAGTTPTAITLAQDDPNSVPPLSTWASAFATPPSTSANDDFVLPLNTQSTVDLPWEGVEEFSVTKGTANGLAFINRSGFNLPANTSLVISWTIEE